MGDGKQKEKRRRRQEEQEQEQEKQEQEEKDLPCSQCFRPLLLLDINVEHSRVAWEECWCGRNRELDGTLDIGAVGGGFVAGNV